MTRELYLGTLVRAEQVVQPANEMKGRFFCLKRFVTTTLGVAIGASNVPDRTAQVTRIERSLSGRRNAV